MEIKEKGRAAEDRPGTARYADAIAAIDMCVVPTLTFDRLFALLVLGHGRRQLLRHPTAEWLAWQITETFPWASAPDYLVRDNDHAYGQIFTARVKAMGIRDRPITPGSPWQNGIAERLIGTLRRECLDQIVVFGRGAFAPCALCLCGLLQSNASASVFAEGCAVTTSHPTSRQHRRHPNSWWITSPIRPDIYFGKDRCGERRSRL